MCTLRCLYPLWKRSDGLRRSSGSLQDKKFMFGKLIESDMYLTQSTRVLALGLFVLFCVSCQRNAPRTLAKSAVLEVYSVSSGDAPNTRALADPQTGSQVFLILPPILTSADVASVQRAEDSHDSPSLTVNLTPLGAKKLSAATTPALGQELAFVVNGHVTNVAKVLAPLLNSFNISGGSIQKDRDEIFATLTKD